MRHWPLALLGLIWTINGQCSGGAYLFDAAGCLACHTGEGGAPLAGGRRFDTPYGVYYSPNISRDPETGIGNWSKAQFIRALKHGEAPDGSAYFPTFPYPSYRLLHDDDAGALFDHLMTLKPQQQENREHELPWWLARWMMGPWQWFLLDEPGPPPADPVLRRGRYLVDALGHCGECHTPRNALMITDASRAMAGGPHPRGEGTVPGLLDMQGRGRYSDVPDLVLALQFGETFGYDRLSSGGMADVQMNLAKLPEDDLRAIAEYLLSLE